MMQFKSDWADLRLGDCCELILELADNSVDYGITSPPFANLFVYSDDYRDMGNCKNTDDFIEHFKFLAIQMLRVIKPGRLVSLHCQNLRTTVTNQGYVGMEDFRGKLIAVMVEVGWIYHSEVCIWKSPVVERARLNSLALLHKTVIDDSSRAGSGRADYLCSFRKPGINEIPIQGVFTEYYGDDYDAKLAKSQGRKKKDLSLDIWQRYASPVWMDINQSDTLSLKGSKDENDERHICPLQLGVIARGLQIWSLPGELVLDPFNGIGSTGYQSILMNRKYVGFELKKAYFDVAVKNIRMAEVSKNQLSLFDTIDYQEENLYTEEVGE